MLDIPTPPQTNERKALQLDEHRNIISDVVEKIPEPWDEAIEPIIDMYKKGLGEKNIHSIYVLGSVARGLAIKGKSDMDAIAVVYDKDVAKEWIEKARNDLKEKFNFATKFDLGIVSENDLRNDEDYFKGRLMIKTSGLKIYGDEDLTQTLPNVKADKETARALKDNLEERIKQTKRKMDRFSEEHEIKDTCKWIMKRVVRSGFMLVLAEEKVKVFTVDMEPSYKVFAERYPEKADDMKEALNWAENPTDNPNKVKEFLDDFGKWLQDSLKEKFPDEVGKSEEKPNQHPETSPHPHSHTSDTSSKA